jgi:hypothetical protein
MINRLKSAVRHAEDRRRRQAAAYVLRELDSRIIRDIGLEAGHPRNRTWGIDPRF